MNRTLTILKPDSVEEGYTGKILDMIIQSGFKIVAIKMVNLTIQQAQKFYEIHQKRLFFDELVKFMTRSSIIVAILEKDNAVEDFRTLIGSTDPAEAAENTIRSFYAKSKGCNAIHGSDSDENSKIEQGFFFPGIETI